MQVNAVCSMDSDLCGHTLQLLMLWPDPVCPSDGFGMMKLRPPDSEAMMITLPADGKREMHMQGCFG